MKLTQEQIKGRLKQKSKIEGSDPRILIRYYMMERFLERLSLSKYKDNFIFKGGFIITSLLGNALRSTMDIDASISGFDLSIEKAEKIINDIIDINLDDNVSFKIINIEHIMADMEYPGIRFNIESYLQKMIVPLKIDVSTGYNIYPKAIDYGHKLLIEDRKINIWSYSIENVLAEKLQTILYKNDTNTRMRDYYDIYALLNVYSNTINLDNLKLAVNSTMKNRRCENLLLAAKEILSLLEHNERIIQLWNNYRSKYIYAKDIEFSSTINSIRSLIELIKN